MCRNEILNKKTLKENIILSISNNNLGYTFAKYNDRIYYFTRKSKNPEAYDYFKMKVSFKKGKIYCSLQSIVDKRYKDEIFLTNGLLNRHEYLVNRLKKNKPFPENVFYRFENSIESLNKTLKQIVTDLHIRGTFFNAESDYRFESPKYVESMKYINSLQIDSKSLKVLINEEFKRVKYSIPKNEHPIFLGLVKVLNKIQSPDYTIQHHLIAYEFINMYMNRESKT